jgi:hypothetical protein
MVVEGGRRRHMEQKELVTRGPSSRRLDRSRMEGGGEQGCGGWWRTAGGGVGGKGSLERRRQQVAAAGHQGAADKPAAVSKDTVAAAVVLTGLWVASGDCPSKEQGGVGGMQQPHVSSQVCHVWLLHELHMAAVRTPECMWQPM